MTSTNEIEQDKIEQEVGNTLPGDEEQPVDQEGPVQGKSEESSVLAPDPLKCNVHFTITMLPSDNDPQGRQVLLGARTDNDDPLVVLTRASGPADLLPALQKLYERLIAELAQRKESTQKRLAAAPKRQENTVKKAVQTKASVPTPKEATIPTEQQKTIAPVDKPELPVKQKSSRTTKPNTEHHTEQMTLF